MFKRIFLFIIVNILTIVTISITLNVLGVRPYLNANGIDYQALLIFCGVVGFTGALFSLATSRIMAKMLMGVKVIDPSKASSAERELVATVHRLAQKAGLPGMPEVGIYNSPEINAFATGPTKSRALVAVSAGLLQRMDGPAVEGVLSHEIAHIANGDMVTMTLLQGVVNTFVMFFARIAAWGVAQAFAGNRDSRDSAPSPLINFVLVIVFEIFFSLLGAIVVAYFSRRREFRADAGGAQYAGREKMVHALRSLKAGLPQIDEGQPAIATLKISGKPRGLFQLFASHPDLEVRIARLQGR